VNDVDRWVNLEGPEPEGIRELLDAAREVPDMTPEQEARMDRSLHAAIAEDRRRWARQRTVKRVLALGLVAACLAFAVVLAIRLAAPPDLATARRLLPSATRQVPNQLEVPVDTAPSAPPALPQSPRVGPRSPDR
jgi:hypothetical protein